MNRELSGHDTALHGVVIWSVNILQLSHLRLASCRSRRCTPIDGDKCFYWQTSGCFYGDKCRFQHIPGQQGRDSKPWPSLQKTRVQRPPTLKYSGTGGRGTPSCVEERASSWRRRIHRGQRLWPRHDEEPFSDRKSFPPGEPWRTSGSCLESSTTV